VVNADGRFRLAAVPAGEYELKVTSGQDTVTRKISLSVRDSAILSVMIRKQSGGSRIVVVESMHPMRLARGGALRDGVAGGIFGDIAQPRMQMLAAAPPPVPATKAAMAVNSVTEMRREADTPAP